MIQVGHTCAHIRSGGGPHCGCGSDARLAEPLPLWAHTGDTPDSGVLPSLAHQGGYDVWCSVCLVWLEISSLRFRVSCPMQSPISYAMVRYQCFYGRRVIPYSTHSQHRSDIPGFGNPFPIPFVPYDRFIKDFWDKLSVISTTCAEFSTGVQELQVTSTGLACLVSSRIGLY